MQNETHNTTQSKSDINRFAEEIREAVAQGGDIEKKIRELTLEAMHTHGLDMESLKKIATAVMEGAHEGSQHALAHATEQSHAAQTQIVQAVAGLDTAFAQLASASKLALEEAASKARQFSQGELTKTQADLESLETLFLETLSHAAKAAQGLIAETLQDVHTHAVRNGTAVGAQLKDTLAVLAHQVASTGRAQVEAGLQLTQMTADMLHKISSGVLTGIADRIRQHDDK
ncbi:MAG: DUF6781 family protein [Nitrosomonas sp.]|jgi:hypothetical protein|nr:hypothetical protein [Nitrosomonas sp.]